MECIKKDVTLGEFPYEQAKAIQQILKTTVGNFFILLCVVEIDSIHGYAAINEATCEFPPVDGVTWHTYASAAKEITYRNANFADGVHVEWGTEIVHLIDCHVGGELTLSPRVKELTIENKDSTKLTIKIQK